MTKRIVSAVCSFMLGTVFLFSAVPAQAEGVLAENITWRTEGSALIFEGQGDMVLTYEYLTEIPWYNQRTEVDTLIIGEGITSIAEGSFSAFRLLKNVTLPSTLDTIGSSAFLSCEG